MYNFKTNELSVLKFWKDRTIYEKLKQKNKKGKPFYFLQGPPYTSGRIHIGQAWNNTLKDMTLRFKHMKGFNVWDRAGYDTHGLPTANLVQKKLQLLDKESIMQFGMDKFIKHCMETSNKYAKIMSEDLLRLGIWMDYKNAYMPNTNNFMENEWWLIKQAHKQKRLYKGKKIMHWCASCETALAKHELEYKDIKEKSIFLKFKLKNKKKDDKKEYLIIWTTTPWTIPFNLAVMVNPKIDYVKAKVDNEIWILAKELVKNVIEDVLEKKYKIIETFKGKKLLGLEYESPFYKELKEQYNKLKKKHKKVHTIILSERYVTTETGSGLVHCAPGCGPEDFEVGHEYNIPPFNTLDEKGTFKDLGIFTNLIAKKDDSKINEILEKNNALLKIIEIKHEYPFCWRCNNPVIFRATEQWFLKIEDLIPKMLKINEKVEWIPKWGKEAFDSWIKVLRDNSITRQRFWGTPVPIWECNNCGKVIVIGSKKELQQKATTKIPENLHKPWVDDIKIKCNKCGANAKRIPDVLDVWLDSGTTSWNCLYYPKKKNFFNKFFPADFILEATEQIKLWFSMLSICGTIALKKPIYKTVYMHGMILDWKGKKMSKSLGNIISPYEVIDKYGVDVFRYYISEITAGENISFSWELVKQKHRHINILWNIKNYILELANLIKSNPEKIKPKPDIEEKYILSRCHTTIEEVTKLFENYHLDEVITKIESLFLELSRVYIQLIREKSSIGSKKEKQAILYATYQTLLNCIKLFSPVCPFITETIYQEFKKEFKLKKESIHLCEWPKSNKKLIDKKLEQDFSLALEIIEKTLAKRSEVGIGIRWPLAKLDIETNQKLNPKLEEVIKKQVNVKKINLKKKASKKKILKVTLDIKISPELEAEGYARETARFIQGARKKAGLIKEQKITLIISCEKKIQDYIKKNVSFIKERVNASKLTIKNNIKQKQEHEFEKEIKKQKIKIAFSVK